MRLSELIQQLEDIQNCIDGDPEVRIASQPNYPLQSTIYGAVSSDDVLDAEDMNDEEKVVWIVERSQCRDPYAPRSIWENF